MDYWRYQKARREYEERTGEEFPGLGEDRQRRERQRAAEARVAEEEAARTNEDPHPPSKKATFCIQPLPSPLQVVSSQGEGVGVDG